MPKNHNRDQTRLYKTIYAFMKRQFLALWSYSLNNQDRQGKYLTSTVRDGKLRQKKIKGWIFT